MSTEDNATLPLSSLPGGKPRHKRVPSTGVQNDLATFGKVEEGTQAVEQDPTGRVSQQPWPPPRDYTST